MHAAGAEELRVGQKIGEDMGGALEKKRGKKKHNFNSCPGPVLSRTENGINVGAV